jgi:hypothetical protein
MAGVEPAQPAFINPLQKDHTPTLMAILSAEPTTTA